MSTEEFNEGEHVIKAIIPEYFNCMVYGDSLSIDMTNKVDLDTICAMLYHNVYQMMGNFLLECKSGNVKLDKIRGSDISLNCANGLFQCPVRMCI